KVTSLAGAGARTSPPRNALGSVSPNSMRRLRFHQSFVVASLSRRTGAAARALLGPGPRPNLRDFAPQPPGCGIFDRRNHGFVKRFTMRPHFSQARAKLDCEVVDR